MACGSSGGVAVTQVPALPDVARGDVEIWNDGKPNRAFVATGQLRARAIDHSASVQQLQREAKRLYMSGIYDVECVGPRAGECTATGFVYRDAPDQTASLVAR
jgi:hypothetical protein